MKCFFVSILHFTFLFFSSYTCKALDLYQFIDARAQSMGTTMSVLPGFSNPAGYGFTTKREGGLYYINRYGIKELATYAAGVNIPNPYLNTGLYISRYGFTEFNQLQISGNFYGKLSEYLILGIRFNYTNLHYSGKENSHSLFSGDIGVLIRPVDKWNISVLAINPFKTYSKTGETKIEISGALIVGASYQIDENFLITGEIQKDFIYPFVCKTGLEYRPVKEMRIRAGMFGKPFTPTFGIGVHFHSFILDVAFNRHSVLGYELSGNLLFNF